jgi:23S rRNA (pseudouridine1915-N3)-methyltransferase
MRTALLAVGRLRPVFREACDEYLARLRRYDEVVERELKEAAAAKPGPDRLKDEGHRLLEALPVDATVVVLDRRGTAWTSEGLARQVQRWRLAARPVALVLGGAAGLAADVLDRADHRWSLGPLTLPHELARVVVLEQWYRAGTILRGEPYHR